MAVFSEKSLKSFSVWEPRPRALICEMQTNLAWIRALSPPP